MAIITFNFQYDANGNIIYGPQPLGLFLISGLTGPEILGFPNIPMSNGFQFAVNSDGSLTPITSVTVLAEAQQLDQGGTG